MDTIVVLTNLPERAAALELAEKLVASRSAACVNVLADCTSVYRWQGKIETAGEITLLIKTRQALYPEVEALIRRHHPYELPEIIAVPLIAGQTAYLEWIAAETQPDIKS